MPSPPDQLVSTTPVLVILPPLCRWMPIPVADTGATVPAFDTVQEKPDSPNTPSPVAGAIRPVEAIETGFCVAGLERTISLP